MSQSRPGRIREAGDIRHVQHDKGKLRMARRGRQEGTKGGVVDNFGSAPDPRWISRRSEGNQPPILEEGAAEAFADGAPLGCLVVGTHRTRRDTQCHVMRHIPDENHGNLGLAPARHLELRKDARQIEVPRQPARPKGMIQPPPAIEEAAADPLRVSGAGQKKSPRSGEDRGQAER